MIPKNYSYGDLKKKKKAKKENRKKRSVAAPTGAKKWCGCCFHYLHTQHFHKNPNVLRRKYNTNCNKDAVTQ